MKIKPEHYDYIKQKFINHGKLSIDLHRIWLQSPENPRKPKDLEMRLRWDIANATVGSKWICDNLYPYLNDSHIDTALKKIIEEIK